MKLAEDFRSNYELVKYNKKKANVQFIKFHNSVVFKERWPIIFIRPEMIVNKRILRDICKYIGQFPECDIFLNLMHWKDNRAFTALNNCKFIESLYITVGNATNILTQEAFRGRSQVRVNKIYFFTSMPPNLVESFLESFLVIFLGKIKYD